MFRALVILFAVTASVLAEEQCAKFFQHGVIMKCCKGELPKPTAEDQAIFKECHSLPQVAPCDRELCIATKKGFVTPDGKLDAAKVKESISKEYDTYPVLVTAIVEKCASGDLSKFGSADTCDATKFRHCIQLQLIKTCPEWSNDGPCEGLQDLREECKKKYE